MSKTMLTTKDVPQYIRDIVKNLRITTDYEENDIPGYTFRLYGKHRVGYESQLAGDCEKLVDWCKRYYADAYVVKESFWWDEVPYSQAIGHGTKWHKAKAYRDGYRNSIKLVITDPVAHRFDMDGYYREREPLNRLISSAKNTKTAQLSKSDNVRQKSQLERE